MPADPRRVLLHTSKYGTMFVRAAAPQAGFDYPATLQGSTAHFNVYYDPSLGSDGVTIANGVLATCEADYQTLSGYFAGITPPGLPFNIVVAPLSSPPNGTGGAYHDTCAAVTLYCDAKTTPSVDVDLTRFLVIAEEVEVFEAAQGVGWDCGANNGEGLSRVLATELYPNELDGYATAAAWLDSSNRPDYVDTTDPTDQNPVSTGCAVLFLNYLRYQLNFSWSAIVGAGAPMLGQTYTNLTGATNGFQQFSTLLQANYPIGTPSGLTTDNPFPLPAATS
jgi:hypothetical protein